MKLGRPVGLVSGGSNPTGPSNRQTKSVSRGLMSNPEISIFVCFVIKEKITTAEQRISTNSDAPCVAFYDMHAVMFVLLYEMAMSRSKDCSGLFLYPN